MTVVFAAGGTGGHIYPAIAIADALRERSATVSFIGTADRLEARLVPAAGYPFASVSSRPLPRRISVELLRAFVRNVRATFQSLALLSRARPDLVIATGGYVCFPVGLAARIRRALRRSRAPLVLLEPNAVPGITTRMLTPIADEIWVAGDHLRSHAVGRYRATGIPVRASIRHLPDRAGATSRLGLDSGRRTLVAIGGSQGARSINGALVALVRHGNFPSGWQLLLATGDAEYERVAAELAVAPSAPAIVRAYFDDMADVYAAADLVLARSGASTLAELAAAGKPAILVPYPYASEGHQAANAAAFERAGAAVVCADGRLASDLGGLLRETVSEGRLAALTAGARALAASDPLEAILARVDALTGRKPTA